MKMLIYLAIYKRTPFLNRLHSLDKCSSRIHCFLEEIGSGVLRGHTVKLHFEQQRNLFAGFGQAKLSEDAAEYAPQYLLNSLWWDWCIGCVKAAATGFIHLRTLNLPPFRLICLAGHVAETFMFLFLIFIFFYFFLHLSRACGLTHAANTENNWVVKPALTLVPGLFHSVNLLQKAILCWKTM